MDCGWKKKFTRHVTMTLLWYHLAPRVLSWWFLSAFIVTCLWPHVANVDTVRLRNLIPEYGPSPILDGQMNTENRSNSLCWYYTNFSVSRNQKVCSNLLECIVAYWSTWGQVKLFLPKLLRLPVLYIFLFKFYCSTSRSSFSVRYGNTDW